MIAKILGYFKFSPIKRISVKLPDEELSEIFLRRAAGQNVYFTPSAAKDTWNALLGKCAEQGWYKNGGWRPNGSTSNRCQTKDIGDILGICVMFLDYSFSIRENNYTTTRSWLYCDREFEKAVLNDFFQPDERLKMEIMYSICGSLVKMDNIPSQKWLDGFCSRTHDPKAFQLRKFGKEFSDKEISFMLSEKPSLKKYVKLMIRPESSEK